MGSLLLSAVSLVVSRLHVCCVLGEKYLGLGAARSASPLIPAAVFGRHFLVLR